MTYETYRAPQVLLLHPELAAWWMGYLAWLDAHPGHGDAGYQWYHKRKRYCAEQLKSRRRRRAIRQSRLAQ